MEAHLSDCPSCRALLEDERALAEALSMIPAASPRRDLWDAVHVRVAALGAPAPAHVVPVARSRPAPRARHWLAAATFVAAAGLAMLAPPREPSAVISWTYAPGAATVAATLDHTRSVVRQSDDPLEDFSDATWAALGEPGKG